MAASVSLRQSERFMVTNPRLGGVSPSIESIPDEGLSPRAAVATEEEEEEEGARRIRRLVSLIFDHRRLRDFNKDR